MNYVLTVTELSFPLFHCLILLLYLSLLLFSFFCLSTLNDVFPKKKNFMAMAKNLFVINSVHCLDYINLYAHFSGCFI